MKSLVLLWLLSMSPLASAETPTEAYLAARDQAVLQMRAFEATLGNSEIYGAEHIALDKALLKPLEANVRELVGPISLPGFPAIWGLSLDTLTAGINFGALDGLTAVSKDRGVSAIVTTLPLLSAWIAKNCPGDIYSKPSSLSRIFTDCEFFNQFVHGDAAGEVEAEIPVRSRMKGDFAWGGLIHFSQTSFIPYAADFLFASLVRRERVYFFSQKISPVHAKVCEAALRRAFDQLKRQGSADGEPAGELVTEFRVCYEEEVKKPVLMTELSALTQAMLDIVPGR